LWFWHRQNYRHKDDKKYPNYFFHTVFFQWTFISFTKDNKIVSAPP